MNDLLFVIWKMTQGWDEGEKVAIEGFMGSPGLHGGILAELEVAKSFGKTEAGQEIRELLTAAGYKHKEG